MSALEMDDIPADFPVRPIDPAALEYRTDPETGRTVWFRTTCGECGLSWDDTIPTAYTPAPSARCPFEQFHEMDEPAEDEPITAEDRAIILEALETWRAFGRYGDGRDEFRARVQTVIDKIENGADL